LETPIFLLFRADSVTWNPHKLLGVPQQCSTFLTRHTNLLLEANSASASYLFQKDKFYDPKWDVGDKYLQCGRRADVLKFWLMWQAKVNFHLHKKKIIHKIPASFIAYLLFVVYKCIAITNYETLNYPVKFMRKIIFFFLITKIYSKLLQ
jgi:hypothetical protein